MLNMLLTCSMYHTTILDSLSCLEGLRRCVVGNMYLKDIPRTRWLQSECGWQWGLGRPHGRSRRKRMALPSSSWTPTRTQSSCGASTFYPLHAQTSNLTRSNVVFFIPNGKDFDARVCVSCLPTWGLWAGKQNCAGYVQGKLCGFHWVSVRCRPTIDCSASRCLQLGRPRCCSCTYQNMIPHQYC